MSSNDIAITVRNLTKSYRLFGHPGDRIKQALSLGCMKFHHEFTALKDVSFEIKKGETVGIVGRNGSGKSTLLQLICGILKPTSGRVHVNGRVSALLELGAGFNPEFTGRENVFFQGALMGFTQAEMKNRFDDIASFAGIGEFIDQPVRTYSSGMFVRLAFSTAIHADPDVLVIDEALAVGDVDFRARCFRRIAELSHAGCTILFVSHALEQITRVCSRAMLIDGGNLLLLETPELVIKQFQCLLATGLGSGGDAYMQMHGDVMRSNDKVVGVADPARGLIDIAEADSYAPDFLPESTFAYEEHGALIDSVRILTASGLQVNQLRSGQTYRCAYRVHFTQDVVKIRFAMLIRTQTGIDLGGAMSAPAPAVGIESLSVGEVADVEFEFKCALNPGTYFLNVAVFGSMAHVEYSLHGLMDAAIFRVVGEGVGPAIAHVDFGCRATIQTTGSTVQ